MLTLAGRAEVVSLASLGLFLFLLEKDPAMADQFLKGETMTVLAVTSELQPKLELFRKQLHYSSARHLSPKLHWSLEAI